MTKRWSGGGQACSTTWAGSPGPVAGDVLSFGNSSAKASSCQGTATPRTVNGWRHPTLSDASVCFLGASSAGTGSCGPLDSVGTVYSLEGFEFPAFSVAAVPKGGDSGAPFYVQQPNDRASARGLLSFMQDVDGNGTYDRACGTPMSAVLAATGSSLLIG